MCFRKRKPRAIGIFIKKGCYKCHNVWMTGKVTTIFNITWITHGHLGGVKRYEWHLWAPAGFCDLGQQVDLYTKPFWSHGGAENLKLNHGFEISSTLTDMCHMPYIFFFNQTKYCLNLYHIMLGKLIDFKSSVIEHWKLTVRYFLLSST